MLGDLWYRITGHGWTTVVFVSWAFGSFASITLLVRRQRAVDGLVALPIVGALAVQIAASIVADGVFRAALLPSSDDPEKRTARLENAVGLYVDVPLVAFVGLCPLLLFLAWRAVAGRGGPRIHAEAVAATVCAILAIAIGNVSPISGMETWWLRAPCYAALAIVAARSDTRTASLLPIVVAGCELMGLAAGQLVRQHQIAPDPHGYLVFLGLVRDELTVRWRATAALLTVSSAPLVWRTVRGQERLAIGMVVTSVVILAWATRDPRPFYDGLVAALRGP